MQGDWVSVLLCNKDTYYSQAKRENDVIPVTWKLEKVLLRTRLWKSSCDTAGSYLKHGVDILRYGCAANKDLSLHPLQTRHLSGSGPVAKDRRSYKCLWPLGPRSDHLTGKSILVHGFCYPLDDHPPWSLRLRSNLPYVIYYRHGESMLLFAHSLKCMIYISPSFCIKRVPLVPL